jgi:hypothetical protein
MADTKPKSTDQLLALIEQEWNELMQVVGGLTPEQMTTADSGGWSPKDNLAHLAAWMRFMEDSYLHKMPGYQAMDIDAEKWKQLDEDGINAVLFERNRNRSTEDVLNGIRSTYADVVQTLRQTPFASLMEPANRSKPGGGSTLDFVLGNTSDHFREHRLNVEKGLKK